MGGTCGDICCVKLHSIQMFLECEESTERRHNIQCQETVTKQTIDHFTHRSTCPSLMTYVLKRVCEGSADLFCHLYTNIVARPHTKLQIRMHCWFEDNVFKEFSWQLTINKLFKLLPLTVQQVLKQVVNSDARFTKSRTSEDTKCSSSDFITIIFLLPY